MNIVETCNLTKTYGGFTAVSRLNLHIRKGNVYGFLGPNGAGKSTTMKMFLGLTRPSGGSFAIAGLSFPKDRAAILKQVGSFIESPAYYGNLSGRENLEIIQKLLGLPSSACLLYTSYPAPLQHRISYGGQYPLRRIPEIPPFLP